MDERFPRRARRFAAVMLVAAGALSCGDDDPAGPGDGPFEGTYTATVSGAVTATLGGTAIFASGTDPDTGESAWVVYLVENENAAFTSGNNVFFAGFGPPEERSYMLQDISESQDIPESGAGGVVIMYDGQMLTGAFLSTGGSLTITDLSADRMDGTFNFTAVGNVFDGQTATEGAVTVQGSFEAQTGAFVVPPIGT